MFSRKNIVKTENAKAIVSHESLSLSFNPIDVSFPFAARPRSFRY